MREGGRLREVLASLCHVMMPEVAILARLYSSMLDLNGFLGFSWGIGGNFSTDFCFYEMVGTL